MSFGKYQYQHRFYKNEPHKKMVGAYTSDNNVLPISNYVSTPHYYTPQVPKPVVYDNSLNLRVRAGEIGYNQPGWEGYRLKSYVTDKYSQNYHSYQNDREIIQKFKREAAEHKRRNRLQSQFTRNPYRTIQKMPQYRVKTQQSINEFLPSINPERQQSTARYDVGIMARLKTQAYNRDGRKSRQQERRSKEERQEQKQRWEEQERRREEYKLRDYKKKYKKLKSKLKQQLSQQKRIQEQTRYNKNNKSQQSEFDKIEHLISDVSQQIVKNTVIFNQGLRVQRQLQQVRLQNPKVAQQQKLPAKVQQQQSRISTFAPEEQKEHKASPKIVYTPKSLNKSYLQLQQLRSQMEYINKKMAIQYPK